MTHLILVVAAFLFVTVFALAGACNLDRYEARLERYHELGNPRVGGGDS